MLLQEIDKWPKIWCMILISMVIAMARDYR